MESKTSSSPKLYFLLLSSLSKHQRELIKSSVVDVDNHFNEVFPSFDLLNPEFALGCGIIDIFPSCFSFNLFSKCNEDNLKSQICQLDNMTIMSSNNTSHALIIMDASIKNNIATSISHICIRNKPITKTLHHVVNVMSTEAKLFAIRCSINQAINSTGISKSLLSWIQYTLQERSSIHCCIPFKFMQLLSLKNFVFSSLVVKKIWSNSGSVQVDTTSHSTKLLTKRPSCLILYLCSLANHLGTLVKRTNVMTLLIDGK